MPFFSGADGQAAVRLALQLAENPEVTVTLVHYQVRIEGTGSEDAITAPSLPEGKIMVSISHDKSDEDDFFVTMQQNLPDALRTRVTFRTIISHDPVQDAVADAHTEVGQNVGNGGDIIMLARNVELVESQASSCLGLVADVMLEKDVKASIIVVQARRE
jgi:K+:H+ antiporter